MKHPSKRRTVKIMVRFTPDEAAHIRSIVRANTGTVSEFVRVCVNGALAQEGDPEAAKLLSAMFEQGITKAIQRRVAAAIREERKKAE